jgi:hypothetical protein
MHTMISKSIPSCYIYSFNQGVLRRWGNEIRNGKWWVVNGMWELVRREVCMATCKWQVSNHLWVYLFTQYIGNLWLIQADSARVDWSKTVQASSVQGQNNWWLVWARSKNSPDWIGLDLEGPGSDWSIAGLVESLSSLSARDSMCLYTPTISRLRAADFATKSESQNSIFHFFCRI